MISALIAGVGLAWEADGGPAEAALWRRLGAYAEAVPAPAFRVSVRSREPGSSLAPGAPIVQSAEPDGAVVLAAGTGHGRIDRERSRLQVEAEPCGPLLDAGLRLLLAHHVLSAGGLILHASAVERFGRVHVFAGSSGAGKSTIARHLPGRVYSDEAVALLPTVEAGLRVESTPYWSGTPASGPLGTLAFLGARGQTQRTRLGAAQVAARLCAHTGPLLPSDRARAFAVSAAIASGLSEAYEVTMTGIDDVVDWLAPRLEQRSSGG